IDLVKENQVIIQFGANPHIIGLSHYSIDKQIQVLEDGRNNKVKLISTLPGKINFSVESHSICVYPSPSYLKSYRDVSSFDMSPYTKELALGQPQLKPI